MTKKTNLKVCFRVDSSIEIGSGHTMRCVTLALELKKQYNADCYFITRPLNGHLNELIIKHNFNIFLLPLSLESDYGCHANAPKHSHWLQANWSLDAELTRSYLSAINADILVVDHYALDYKWEELASGNDIKILIIDDLADRPHIAHQLLDYTLNRRDQDYFQLVNSECELLTGLKYVLLREEFKLSRQKPSFDQRDKIKIFINMGGVDKHNYTQRVMEALFISGYPHNHEYVVVTGKNYAFYNELSNFLERLPIHCEIFRNANNMSTLMRGSNLAISAMGSTTWELISQGIPCLLLATAENQRRHLREMSISGLAEVITDFSSERFNAQFNDLIQSIDKLKDLSERGYMAIDSCGTSRVTEALLGMYYGTHSNSI